MTFCGSTVGCQLLVSQGEEELLSFPWVRTKILKISQVQQNVFTLFSYSWYVFITVCYDSNEFRLQKCTIHTMILKNYSIGSSSIFIFILWRWHLFGSWSRFVNPDVDWTNFHSLSFIRFWNWNQTEMQLVLEKLSL